MSGLSSRPIKAGETFKTLGSFLNTTFQELQYRSDTPQPFGLLLGFGTNQGHHSVAVFVNTDKTVSFYDANAGSYLLHGSLAETDKITEFFTDYLENCLPKKWPGVEVNQKLTAIQVTAKN